MCQTSLNMIESTALFNTIRASLPASSLFSTLVLLFSVFLITKSIQFVCRELRTWYYFRKIPGPPYLSWFGTFVLGTIDIYFNTMRHLSREKGNFQLITALYSVDSFYQNGFAKVAVGTERSIILFRQDYIEKFINSMEFIEKSSLYRFLNDWLGRGLLTSGGDKWKRHRKLLTPAFHFKILDSFFPVMNDNAEIMIKRFEETIVENEGVDIRSLIGDCTLDTICETAMGTTVGAQLPTSDIEYIEPLNQMLRLVMRRMMDPLKHNELLWNLSSSGREFNRMMAKTGEFVNKIIVERKENMEKTLRENDVNLATVGGQDLELFTKKRYAFLDSLLVTHLKNPKEFTMKDILDEVNTFMFEGHDTTSMALIFTLMLVGSDERVQDRIHEELDTIFDEDNESPITLENTRHMKYLEMVIKEGVRLYPSVPTFARKLTKDFQMDDLLIPAGVQILFMPYILHRDPNVFPNPERFIPERFEPDAPVHKMPYAYVPFSAGPRNCIGQKFAMLEMKIILASVLRKYKARSITIRDEIDLNFSIITKTETPVVISFERRFTK